ncbi:MAG TPA: sulfatase [Vicinamibacteria bacterium]|nr:sulfatase [Vicinamibacteria bacterium]
MRARLFATALAALLAAAVACKGGTPPRPSAAPSTDAAALARARPGNPLDVLLVTIDTLRADHLGAYGYARPTSPAMDALAREGAVFDQAYTFWPKTRGSFVMMMTGLRPSQNGYSKTHPVVLPFNETLASVLQKAGYRTEAVVDNPNVAAQLGYAKGFDRYRETWQEAELVTEMDRTRAITADGTRVIREAPRDRPLFLWLHYVNPHAPYSPPAPYDTRFVDASVARSRRLPVVPGFQGGIPRQWAAQGQDRLGWYVAQYDGEIATVDREVATLVEALRAAGRWDRTLVVLTSDHGESLGEHDYYFDHGVNLFDPTMRVPLIVRMPGAPPARSASLVSTLDLVPTVLDAVKVSFPPDLAGTSLLPAVRGGPLPPRERLFGQNERNLTAAWDARHKLVATPRDEGEAALALYDRQADPAETRDVARAQPDAARVFRRELELYLQHGEREWARTRTLVQGHPGEGKMTREACEKLRALNYVVAGCE